jgi:RNA polymerase sigma factor (sigma-70 family)
MDARHRQSSLWESVTPALRKLLDQPFKFHDPAAAALWKKYLATRSKPATQRLYEYYLPVVRIVAIRLKQSRGTMFRDDIGTLISDGFLGLRRAIEFTESFEYGIESWLYKSIRRAIYSGRDAMQFGGRARTYARRTLNAIRADLAARLGRLPERDEILIELRKQFKNPGVYIARIDERTPKMSPVSELENPDLPPLEFADTAAGDPSNRVIESDIMRRVEKVLKPRDRQILRMILRGDTYAEIGRRFHISRERVRQRLNGILWEARGRADLVRYYGTDSVPEMAGAKHGQNRCFDSARARLAG